MQQAPIVTLILGLITAIITAITLIATKENKVSESRQSWINGQRADVVAAVATVQGFYAAPDTEGRARWLAEFHAARTRIALRERPGGEEWHEVPATLDRIGSMLATRRINHVALSEATTVIESAARAPLKRHWERVKAGERGFRIFKTVFQACLGFLAAVGVFLVFQSSRAAPLSRERPFIPVKR
jgi:multisubunit Na+/H+ antiporter MnhB subunit